jgi:hypothetical protein
LEIRRVETASSPTGPTGWGFFPRTALRFVFLYMLLYSFPLLLGFPANVASSVAKLVAQDKPAPDSWFSEALAYVSYPEKWYKRGMEEFTPWLCRTVLGVDVDPPSRLTGSGDGLFQYCLCFAYLVLAAAAWMFWTLASESWRRWKTHRPPDYDRLQSLFRLVVGFHLMYMMLIYGAAKVWCSQFPPISDAQLEATYGDSSPMGLLWRFMQFSQPYTVATGIVEFSCGLLLINRRTTLLGALCAGGVSFQVFLLNMCYDVPVKLLSAHLLLMALLLIAPDARRLLAFFVLGRPSRPMQDAPLFGRWRWLNTAGFVLRTAVYLGFASLTLYQSYRSAKTEGILAPTRPADGRWITTSFARAGKEVALPTTQDENPPKKFMLSKWEGGPGVPAVFQILVTPRGVSLVFEDGSRARFRNGSREDSELMLVSFEDGARVALLRASFPEPEVMVLEGLVGGEEVRIALRKPRVTKDYLLKQRGFRWVQEAPYNK